MKKQKIDTSGTEAAQRAIAEANAQAMNLQKNFQTDLKAENLTQVVAGGAAEELGVETGTAKRRRSAGGLSSQLGVVA